MYFNDKQKRIVCMVVAVAIIVPTLIAAVGSFIGM